MRRGVSEVDLVRADAEAADGDEVLCVGQDAGGELGLAADAQDMDVFDLLNELVFGKGGLEGFDLVALCCEDIFAGLVHILEEEDLNVLFPEGFELFGLRACGGAAEEVG